MPTITLAEETKTDLDSFKIIPKEPYDDLVKRLLKEIKEARKR